MNIILDYYLSLSEEVAPVNYFHSELHVAGILYSIIRRSGASELSSLRATNVANNVPLHSNI